MRASGDQCQSAPSPLPIPASFRCGQAPRLGGNEGRHRSAAFWPPSGEPTSGGALRSEGLFLLRMLDLALGSSGPVLVVSAFGSRPTPRAGNATVFACDPAQLP